MEHHRASVEYRPALIGPEQPGGIRDHLTVRHGKRSFEHALQDQQPVHVARQVVECAPMEHVHQSASPVGLPGAYPEKGSLGTYRGHSFSQRECLAFGRPCRARGGVA